MKVLCSVLFSVCVSVVSLGAADGPAKPAAPAPPAPGGPNETRSKILQRYDKNGDGKLDETETQAMRDERRKLLEERQKEQIKKYDKNGNGKIDDDERDAARAEMLKNRSPGPAPGSPPPGVPAPEPAKPAPAKAPEK